MASLCFSICTISLSVSPMETPRTPPLSFGVSGGTPLPAYSTSVLILYSTPCCRSPEVISHTGLVTWRRPGDIPTTMTSGYRHSEMVPRWAIPPPLPMPIDSRQSTTWVTRPIGILFCSLKDYGSGFAAWISKSEHFFIRVRTKLAVIDKRRLGLHEPAFLHPEGKISEHRFDCGLDCGNDITVLEL